MTPLARIGAYGRMVRFSHTVFALPFAVMGAVLAAHGIPGLRTAILILLAMVGARSAAMAMNRLADHELDSENPRTRGRELPMGILSRAEVWGFLVVSAGAFVVACALLNRMTLLFSPVVLVVLLGYPYAKRFTSLCHLWLGAALGLSPIGAWVAVRGGFGPEFLSAVYLSVAVMLWTAGFDVIYALLDLDHDRSTGIFSVPARLGPARALAMSAFFHVGTVVLLLLVGSSAHLTALWIVGVGVTTALLFFEHWIVRPSDLSRVNTAFFTLNGLVSLLLMCFLTVDVLLGAGPR